MKERIEALLIVVTLAFMLWAAIRVFEVEIRDPGEVYHFGASTEAGRSISPAAP